LSQKVLRPRERNRAHYRMVTKHGQSGECLIDPGKIPEEAEAGWGNSKGAQLVLVTRLNPNFLPQFS
jgi:hypothetical protein